MSSDAASVGRTPNKKFQQAAEPTIHNQWREKRKHKADNKRQKKKKTLKSASPGGSKSMPCRKRTTKPTIRNDSPCTLKDKPEANIPEEVWIHILRYMTFMELAIILQINKKLNRLASDSSLKESALVNSFGHTANLKIPLLRETLPWYQEDHNEDTDNCFHIVLIGAPSVGKKTLISRFCNKDTSSKYDHQQNAHNNYFRTQEASRSITLDGNVVCKLKLMTEEFDLKNSSATNKYMYSKSICHAYVVVFDVTSRDSFNGALKLLELVESMQYVGITKILIGNKIDKPRQVTFDEAKAMSKLLNIDYIETSADPENTENVYLLFSYTTALILNKIGSYYQPKSTNQ